MEISMLRFMTLELAYQRHNLRISSDMSAF